MSTARELGSIHSWMRNHEKADALAFQAGSEKMDTLATKQDLADLTKLFVELDDEGEVKRNPETGHLIPKFATKKDVQPVVAFYDKLALSAQLVNGGGKWLSRFVLGLAALLVAFSIITGAFKGWLVALAAWVLHK